MEHENKRENNEQRMGEVRECKPALVTVFVCALLKRMSNVNKEGAVDRTKTPLLLQALPLVIIWITYTYIYVCMHTYTYKKGPL